VHAARAQQAPSVAASSPTNPIDPLEGKVVREIRISQGLRPSTEDIVRRHLASRQGVPFHHATLVEDRRRLDALRLFSSVEIKPVAAGDEVVLEVDVKETLRLLPLIALSVTDENGVSAGPAFKGINLFGRGTLSSGTAQFGGTTTVSARLERPTVTPGMWALDARAVYRSRRNELFDFDETSTTIEASGGWNWTSRIQVGGRAEFVWFDTGSAEIALSPSGTDHLPAVGLFLTYNSLDPLSNPRVGWFGSVDIARQFGDARSWTLTLDGRRLQPLSARSTLSLVAFAESQSGVVGRDLPEYYQFGIGGTNSVRGWALGSRIGKNQAIATVEYLYSIHWTTDPRQTRHHGSSCRVWAPGR
jgi:outer membrane protein assembly factor BamA